jgi:hypothetical protein
MNERDLAELTFAMIFLSIIVGISWLGSKEKA